MKIITISDTHGKHNYFSDKLPEGDIIIHAGDSTPRGSQEDIEEFLRWFGDLEYDMKILIAGNHDWDFERHPDHYQNLFDSYGVTYLNDSGCKYKGLKIWGSPVQPEFGRWAFNRARTESSIGKHWKLIPDDTDILITHGPPALILDVTQRSHENAGCGLLWYRIQQVKPSLHIFGHIHEGRGVVIDKKNGSPVTYNNASALDVNYKPWDDDVFCFDWAKVILGDSRGRDYN